MIAELVLTTYIALMRTKMKGPLMTRAKADLRALPRAKTWTPVRLRKASSLRMISVPGSILWTLSLDLVARVSPEVSTSNQGPRSRSLQAPLWAKNVTHATQNQESRERVIICQTLTQ